MGEEMEKSGLDPLRVVAELARLTEAVSALQRISEVERADAARKREQVYERLQDLTAALQPLGPKLEEMSRRMTAMAEVVDRIAPLVRDHERDLPMLVGRVRDLEQVTKELQHADMRRKWMSRVVITALGICGGVLGDRIVNLLGLG